MFIHSIHKGFSFFDNQLSGRAIVFIPGLAANAQYADFLVRAFPHSRILLVELPGHGMAPEPDKAIDIALLSQDLIIALQETGIEKPLLCGHSLGGQMCLLAEIMQRGFARKLILISPAGLESFSTTEIHIIETSLNLASMIQGIRAPRHTSSFLKEHAHVPKSKTMHEYVSSMLRRPVNDLLEMVKCEVQIYFGDHDVLIPNRLFRMESAVAYAKKTVEKIPNFIVHKLPDAGHWPMLENPAELIKALKEHNPELS